MDNKFNSHSNPKGSMPVTGIASVKHPPTFTEAEMEAQRIMYPVKVTLPSRSKVKI